MRLDCFISNEFHDISRQKASELIKQGQVSVNNSIITKPAYKICSSDNVNINKDFFIESYVFCSRAALKLQRFLLNVDSKTFMFAFCCSQIFSDKAHFAAQFTGYLQKYVSSNEWLDLHKNINLSKVSLMDSKDFYPLIRTPLKSAICDMIKDSIVLDVGASSGGFTQVLLTYKPKLVIAQDVGKLQLHQMLRKRQDVLSFENVDIRIFSKNFCDYLPLIEERVKSRLCDKSQVLQFLVCDVSFISLENILQSLCNLSKTMLLLYKPQYEVGFHAKRNKKGVVLDKQAIMKGLKCFVKLLQECGARYIFVEQSLLAGKEGNEEFFIFCQF